MLDRMKSIIRENDMCVLATADGCKPHTSLMTYLPADDGLTVYMMTGMATRKYANIHLNKQVSLLIDTRLQQYQSPHADTLALTAEGEASIINAEQNSTIYLELLNKNPYLNQIALKKDTVIICVRITSLQLLNGVADMHLIQI